MRLDMVCQMYLRLFDCHFRCFRLYEGRFSFSSFCYFGFSKTFHSWFTFTFDVLRCQLFRNPRFLDLGCFDFHFFRDVVSRRFSKPLFIQTCIFFRKFRQRKLVLVSNLFIFKWQEKLFLDVRLEYGPTFTKGGQ